MDFGDLLRAGWLVLVCCCAYGKVLIRRLVMRHPHPLNWPIDIEMIAAGFRVSLYWGNLATMRLLLGTFSRPWFHPWLIIERLQPPGCAPLYWLSLRSSSRSQKPDIVLCYVHGGAFVGGDPLMCAATFQHWLSQLSKQGLHVKVLSFSYPLAPEHPFPAAVVSSAAAFAWVGQQFPPGSGTTIIAVGDSAGGNIVISSLAALRDFYKQPQQQQSQSDVNADVANSSNESSSMSAPAPAGDATRAASSVSKASSAVSSSPATAAIEARVFAQLQRRLEVVTAANMSISGSNNTHAYQPSTGLITSKAMPRMPSALVLVSPATDISPTALFRHAGSATKDNTASNSSPGSNSMPHYDYLPPKLESAGMGRYAEDHEQLCGPYASPVHLPSFEGITDGCWMVLSGGVEILAADIERFVTRLLQSLGRDRVIHHQEPHLPHSWAIIPTPSMWPRQQPLINFIAAEHHAATGAHAAVAAAAVR